MNLSEIILHARRVLCDAGIENPALDARLLVAWGGSFSDVDLIAGGQTPLLPEQIEKIEKLLRRRCAGEPVSRIRGGREFWGLDFALSPDTLDPRPDTETLVEAALKIVEERFSKRPLRVLDLGTGTGCILISLLKELPLASGIGVDLNPGALTVARENAARHSVDHRVSWLCGSWFDPVEGAPPFDLIVSNPPYIPEEEIESLAREVRNHDPILALSGGPDGLQAYKIILKNLKNHLACGGAALLEIGRGQEKDLARLVDDSMMEVFDSYTDLAGIVRVLCVVHGEK